MKEVHGTRLNYGTGATPSPQIPGVLSLPLFSYSNGTQSSLAPSPWVSRYCKSKRFLQSATDAFFHTDSSLAKCSLMQDRWATQAKGVSDFCHFPLIFLPILQLSQNKEKSSHCWDQRAGHERDWQSKKPASFLLPTNKNKIKISLPNGWLISRFCNEKFISLAVSLLFPVIEQVVWGGNISQKSVWIYLWFSPPARFE